MEQDTSPEQIRKYHELLRRMTPAQRFAATDGLCTTVRDLAWAGLKQRHPNASEDELRTRLTVRLYGPAVARKYHRDVPEDAR